MFHEGYALKKYIEDKRVSINEIAAVLGISRQGVYGLYGMEIIHSDYKDKIKTSKYKIPGLSSEANGHNISNDMNRELEHCREMLKAKDEMIELLKANRGPKK